jgi:nucleoside-diphosphate-sugar epimerase
LKKVILIGGSGFLGRQVLRELLNRGIEVHAVQHHTALVTHPGLSIIEGGIKAIDRDLIRSLKPDAILHLARPKFPRLRRVGRILAARWASMLNKRLIGEIESSGHPVRLIFASGSLMYGPSPLPSDEDAPLKPFSYAKQYYRGEVPVLEALKSGKIPVLVIRSPWLLGQGSWFNWFYIRTMREYHAVPLFGAGNNRMEIIGLNDAARFFVKIAVEFPTSGICNMKTAGAITQLEFANILSGISGHPVKDQKEIFQEHLEKEALQALTSNIVLSTRYPQLTADFQYTPLKEVLKGIIHE